MANIKSFKMFVLYYCGNFCQTTRQSDKMFLDIRIKIIILDRNPNDDNDEILCVYLSVYLCVCVFVCLSKFLCECECAVCRCVLKY